MKWIKKGLVYVPDGRYQWNQSHAQLPIVDAASKQVWRIYFATRDADNRSNASFVEVEAGCPERILYQHNQTILALGRLGSFDESGIMPVSLVNHDGKKYLFYAGWTRRVTIPYHNSIGLAISNDRGQTFQKVGDGPILDIRPREPYFTGTAQVLIDDGVWKMWYQSCTKWEVRNGHPEPFYHIKYAESADGINWCRTGVVAIDYKDENEGGICSASVLKENCTFRMWYSTRGAEDYRHNRANTYRIGYAESGNGIDWTRKDDEVGIDVSTEGWDSEMLAYPFVLKHGGRTFMFYNGNGFGKSGFGYAVLEQNVIKSESK